MKYFEETRLVCIYLGIGYVVGHFPYYFIEEYRNECLFPYPFEIYIHIASYVASHGLREVISGDNNQRALTFVLHVMCSNKGRLKGHL